jgi:Flp pilus assembly protein TadD
VAWLNLARVDMRLGDQVQARQAYDQALEVLQADQGQAFLIPVALQERQAL